MVKLRKELLKCIVCKSVYRETEDMLSSAGIADGTKWFNTECPICENTNTMRNDYVGIPNDILDANLKNNISYQEMLSKHDKKLEKEEKEKADKI